MGVNLYLRHPHAYDDHPAWDTAGLAGDREFARLLGATPGLEATLIEGAEPCDLYYRPADFAQWREFIASRPWPNPGRFEHMLDLLEADPSLALYISW